MKIYTSIIISAFNHEKWISHCLKSLINQKENHYNFEIIVVNDSSKDDTKNILKLFKKNIKIIHNKKNLGLPRSLNKAIKISKGKYIVRVDSDDFVDSRFTIKLRKFLNKNKTLHAVACDYFIVNEKNKILKKKNCTKDIISCGILFKKKYLLDVGLYNEKFKMREGHELRKRFEKKYKIGRLKDPLYFYRDHKKNRTKEKVLIQKYDKILKKI